MRTRIRTVKPEIHLDEELWDLEEESGLPIFRAFTGLMNCADREGRFEWRPRALKAYILPYWTGDFGRVLDALATRGFIGKYASGARAYGVLRTFRKHQAINNRESASELPDPPANLFDSNMLPTREPRDDDATTTREGDAQAEPNRTEPKGTEHASPTGEEEDLPPSLETEPAEPDEDWFSIDTVGAIFSRERKAAGMSLFRHGPKQYDHLMAVVDWAKAEKEDQAGREAIVTGSARSYLKSKPGRRTGGAFPLWASDPGSWIAAEDPATEDNRGSTARAQEKIGLQNDIRQTQSDLQIAIDRRDTQEVMKLERKIKALEKQLRRLA